MDKSAGKQTNSKENFARINQSNTSQRINRSTNQHQDAKWEFVKNGHIRWRVKCPAYTRGEWRKLYVGMCDEMFVKIWWEQNAQRIGGCACPPGCRHGITWGNPYEHGREWKHVEINVKTSIPSTHTVFVRWHWFHHRWYKRGAGAKGNMSHRNVPHKGKTAAIHPRGNETRSKGKYVKDNRRDDQM